MSFEFRKGDSLQLIKTIDSNSIDLLYIDPPFGTTKNFWDEALDWINLFPEMFRVLKKTGMLVIHCSVPFNYVLIKSADKLPSYSWYWVKESPTCPLLANQQPMRIVEEILVWKKEKNTYYRQQIGDEPRYSSYMTTNDYYGPTAKKGKTIIKGKTRTHLLQMKRDLDGFSTRPKEMVELMIKSYTKENDTVLDLFCYKGLTGVVCKELKRNYIGFDKHHIPSLLFQETSTSSIS